MSVPPALAAVGRVVGPWLTIVRFGLVQASVAAVTVLPITTIPRLMRNEIGFLAIAAGILVGIYYAVQVSRVAVGHASDAYGRRSPFIYGGLAILAVGGVATALAVSLMAREPVLGYAAAILGFVTVGVGVGAAGTALLAVLAATVPAERRAPAATIVWLTMILGLVVTATVAGFALTPFSYERLVEVSLAVSVIAFVLGGAAAFRLEPLGRAQGSAGGLGPRAQVAAFRTTWREAGTRRFAVFVFVSMFAFNMQEVVLESFLGEAFGYDAGETTQLSGIHRAGILIGLIAAAVAGRVTRGAPRAMVAITVGGCVASGLSVATLGLSAFLAPAFPIIATLIVFGIANGTFAAGALASMFSLAGAGDRREGGRMGAFGLAQAAGFGLGLLSGALLLDAVTPFAGALAGFASVFLTEALIFLTAAALALRLIRPPTPRIQPQPA